MTTFFAAANPKFTPPEDDGTIKTEPFLKAAKQIVPFFDVLGTAYKPVKSDIDGNVVRLTKRYESAPDKFPTLRSILDDEIQRKCSENKDSATQGLLWLKRALEYLTMFLRLIVEDHKAGKKSENIGPFAKKAYEDTLKKYHSWLIQKIFGMVYLAVPYRKDLLKSLSEDKSISDDQVITDMNDYIEVIEVNLKVLQDMFQVLDLDFQTKV